MTVAKGVAYGSLRRYCATLSEGAGYKQIVLATRFPEQAKQDELLGYVNRSDVTKNYRVKHISLATQSLSIVHYQLSIIYRALPDK